MFQRLSRKGGGSHKNDTYTHKPTFLPLPTTIINFVSRASNPDTEDSPSFKSSPPRKFSVNRALNLLNPSNSRSHNGKLKLGPSGAVIFRPCESQESITSTLPLPTTGILSERVGNALITSGGPSPILKKQKPTSQHRSSSPDSSHSIPARLSRRRSSDNYQPRVSNFLGRHPPPIQRRSASLPPTPLSRIPETQRSPTPERELLFIGGHTDPPSPYFIKRPRLTPLYIQKLKSDMPPCNVDGCYESVQDWGDFCHIHEEEFGGRHSSVATHGSDNDNMERGRSLASNVDKADRGCCSALISKIKTLFVEDAGASAPTGASNTGPVPDLTSAAGSAPAVNTTIVPASSLTTGNRAASGGNNTDA